MIGIDEWNKLPFNSKKDAVKSGKLKHDLLLHILYEFLPNPNEKKSAKDLKALLNTILKERDSELFNSNSFRDTSNVIPKDTIIIDDLVQKERDNLKEENKKLQSQIDLLMKENEFLKKLAYVKNPNIQIFENDSDKDDEGENDSDEGNS